MSMDGQGTKLRRKIADSFNRVSRAYERYRQTDGRQHIANVNLSLTSRFKCLCYFVVLLF